MISSWFGSVLAGRCGVRFRHRWGPGAGIVSTEPAGHGRARRRWRPISAGPRSPVGARVLAGVGVLGASVVSCGPVIGLVVGSIAAPIAVALVRNWQRRRRPGWDRAERDRMPLVLDLVAASLRAGQPLDAALVGAMGCAGPWLAGQLGSVAALLRLGAEPADAWRGLVADQRLRPVTVVAIRSSTSGIKLAAGFTELAVQLRAGAQAQAQAQAHRAGVWAIAPLGLCFPPAFVCLGIAPVVIGLAGPLLNATNPSAPPKLSSTGDVIGQSQGSAGVVRRVETGPVGAPTAQLTLAPPCMGWRGR